MAMPPSPVEPARRDLGRPVTGRRLKLYTIIFEANTRAGRAFDLALVAMIVASVAVVVADGMAAVCAQHGGWLKGLEWFFTLAFAAEYITRRLYVRHPLRYARSLSASSICWPTCPRTWRCCCRRCTR
jgi:voltage-gated potassium channel